MPISISVAFEGHFHTSTSLSISVSLVFYGCILLTKSVTNNFEHYNADLLYYVYYALTQKVPSAIRIAYDPNVVVYAIAQHTFNSLAMKHWPLTIRHCIKPSIWMANTHHSLCWLYAGLHSYTKRKDNEKLKWYRANNLYNSCGVQNSGTFYGVQLFEMNIPSDGRASRPLLVSLCVRESQFFFSSLSTSSSLRHNFVDDCIFFHFFCFDSVRRRLIISCSDSFSFNLIQQNRK